MTGRWLANLALLILVAALALLIRAELDREGRPQTLAGIDPADLSLVLVERDGEPAIRIERSPEGWRIREPIQAAADPERLTRLLSIVGAPVHRSVPAQSAALGELGLAPARLRLKLDSLQLAFGGLDPLGQRRYVIADGLVHLIDDRFHHLLIAPPIDWVSRALLPSGERPAFGTLGGVPLAPQSLKALGAVVAERLEPLSGEISGEAAQLKYKDGHALRFLVSEDRRRWTRLDIKVRYVLADAPGLELNATLIDPTPPEPPPPAPTAPGGPAALSLPVETLSVDEVEPPGTFSDLDAIPNERLTPPPPPDPADPFAPRDESGLGPDEDSLDRLPRPVRLRGANPGLGPAFEPGDEPRDEPRDEPGFDSGFGPELGPGDDPGMDPGEAQEEEAPTERRIRRGGNRPEGIGADPFAPDPQAGAAEETPTEGSQAPRRKARQK